MAKYKIIPSSRTIVQSPISIGHKAEKGVEAIEFDLTAWVETYGSGTLTVIMRRWGDAIPYPIALEIDENNKATWTLSDTDTAKVGMAYAQLSYIVGETVVKKSDIYTFRVMDSLTGEGDPPEAYESWLEHLTHLAAEAMAEVLDIEGIVTDKTLTVDGGIADAKAAGDALALKADKSTTYTKTEVDHMIEDVEVETDTTLSVTGKPADAKKTGDELSALKADLDVYGDSTGLKKDLSNADYVLQVNASTTEAIDNPNGNRIRVIFYVPEKCLCSIQCSYGKGVACSIYGSLENAIRSSTGSIATYTNNNYTKLLTTFSVSVKGYLSISLCKSDSSAFTAEEKNEALNSLSVILIGELTPVLDSLGKNTLSKSRSILMSDDELYDGYKKEIPSYIHGYMNPSGVFTSLSARYISSVYETSAIKEIVNDSDNIIYAEYFTAFTDFDNYTYATYITIQPHTHIGVNTQYPYVNVQGHSTTTELSDLDGVYFIRNSSVEYLSYDNIKSVYNTVNADQMRMALSAQKTFTNNGVDNYAENRLPTFVHVADVHGDATRFENAVKIAEMLNADAILNVGDSMQYYPTDDISFLAESMNKVDFPMLPLVGNHESYTNTEQQMYEKVIAPFATGLVLDTSVDYSTYYYRDFSDKNLRVIGLNQFQYRGVSNMTTQRNYHQAQIDFLCNALISAPDNYGIIVMLHTPEATPSKSSGFDKFYQEERLYGNTAGSIKPIYEIIDAYISGIVFNKTYSNISGNTPADFSVNADFSEKNNSEFIAYVSGHFHTDAVYYISGVTNKQLMLNSVCTNAWSHRNKDGTEGTNYPYYCEMSDLPRVPSSITENALNVYAIDRLRKTVRIVRIGSDMPYDLDNKRDCMTIPYAD